MNDAEEFEELDALRLAEEKSAAQVKWLFRFIISAIIACSTALAVIFLDSGAF